MTKRSAGDMSPTALENQGQKKYQWDSSFILQNRYSVLSQESATPTQDNVEQQQDNPTEKNEKVPLYL